MDKKHILIWIIFIIVSLMSAFFMYYFFYINTGSDQAPAPRELTQNEKNQNAYGEAVLAADKTLCEENSDQELRETCKKVVSDIELYDLATKENDREICNKIENEHRRYACVSVLENWKKENAMASSTPAGDSQD